MPYSTEYVYKLDGATKASLDVTTAPRTAIYYWIESQIAYTNYAHLTFINNLGIYNVDVDTILNSLANLSENKSAEQDNKSIENIVGQSVNIEQLSNVSIENAVEGDYIVFRNGKIRNQTPAHHDFDRSSELWSIFTDNNWDEIPGLCVETSNIDTDDYKFTISMNCSSSSNDRYVLLSVFIEEEEQTHITDEYYFKDKNETNPITITDRLFNVPPGSKITVKVKRGKGNGTTFKVTRRCFFADEIINV